MGAFKKFFCVALAVLLLCLSGIGTANAADAQFTVTVTADKSFVSAGNTVTFTVLAENIKAEGGLISMDVPFRFDTTVFEFAGSLPVYPSEWDYPDDFSYSKAVDGLVWLRILNDGDDFSAEKGCAADGKMGFYVTLRAKKDANVGTSTVTTNGDGGFLVVSGTAADGQCSVAYGTGGSATVNIGSFTGLVGDANLDGKVNNLDAARILKHSAGLIVLSDEAYALADVDGNGVVNTLDAAKILKYDAGLIFGF